jgi:hypothetical protein
MEKNKIIFILKDRKKSKLINKLAYIKDNKLRLKFN